jgi:hypothetical protein
MGTLEGLTKEKNFVVAALSKEMGMKKPNRERIVKYALHAAQKEFEIAKTMIEAGQTEDVIVNLVSMISCIKIALPKENQNQFEETFHEIFK